MSATLIYVLVGLAAFVVAHIFLVAVADRRVAAKRVRMYEIATLLLTSPAFPAERKLAIARTLQHSEAPWAVPLLAIALPFALPFLYFDKRAERRQAPAGPESELEKQFHYLEMASLFAASPLFSLVLGVEILAVALLLSPFNPAKMGKRVDRTTKAAFQALDAAMTRGERELRAA